MKSLRKTVALRIARAVQLNRHRRGVVAAVTSAMSRLAEKQQHRQEVGIWLHPDPEQRIEPRLFTGLLLAEACERVSKAHRKKPFPARNKKEAP